MRYIKGKNAQFIYRFENTSIISGKRRGLLYKCGSSKISFLWLLFHPLMRPFIRLVKRNPKDEVKETIGKKQHHALEFVEDPLFVLL